MSEIRWLTNFYSLNGLFTQVVTFWLHEIVGLFHKLFGCFPGKNQNLCDIFLNLRKMSWQISQKRNFDTKSSFIMKTGSGSANFRLETIKIQIIIWFRFSHRLFLMSPVEVPSKGLNKIAFYITNTLEQRRASTKLINYACMYIQRRCKAYFMVFYGLPFKYQRINFMMVWFYIV